MKKTLIGQFETNGKLLAIDPCYKPKDGATLNVKPGTYLVTTTSGKPKKPFMRWDKIPGTFRIAELTVVHESAKGRLKFNKHKDSFGVDSGQGGIFNLDFFKKNSPVAIELIGEHESMVFDAVIQARSRIMELKQILKKGPSHERFQSLQKALKHTDQQMIDFFKQDLEIRQDMLKDDLKTIKSKKILDEYSELRKSKKFYEIICDVRDRGGNHAGVLAPYGAVSSSGFGDLGFDLSTAKNQKGEIVAVKLTYIKLSEMKK